LATEAGVSVDNPCLEGPHGASEQGFLPEEVGAARMRIAIICHFFAPEPGAPSARLLGFARAWTRMGHQVKVITAFPNHPTGMIPPRYRGRLYMKEELDGVAVFRSWVYARPRAGFFRRTLGHLSFMFSSLLFSLPRVGAVDVVVGSSPTLFSLISGLVISRVKRVPYVIEVRDLWPAAIKGLGLMKDGPVYRLLEALELALYRAARHVVVVTRAFKRDLVARGVPSEKISVITNGVDLQLFRPGPRSPEVEKELDCAGRHLVLYVGNHGLSQGLETVLEAVHLLRDRTDLVFGFVGAGAEKPRLVAAAREMGLSNVRFLPVQPRDRIPDFYRTADICLVSLRNLPIFEGFIPSKMFEIMASGRPMVAAVAGEAAEILRESGGALVVPPGDASALAAAIEQLLADPQRRDEMGENGRRYVEMFFGHEHLAAEYLRVLEELLPRQSPGAQPGEPSMS